jgi:hypothetical protein
MEFKEIFYFGIACLFLVVMLWGDYRSKRSA